MVVKVPRDVTQSTTVFTVAVFRELGASESFQELEHITCSRKQSMMDLFILERGRKRGGTYFCFQLSNGVLQRRYN